MAPFTRTLSSLVAISSLISQFLVDLAASQAHHTVGGGMQTFGVSNATKPCSDCLITWIQAGLEYPNGTTANADSGMVLHHVVATDVGKRSVICPNDFPERWFASGNERTVVNLCLNGTKQAGYHLSLDPTDLVYAELMKMSPDPRPVISFAKLTPVWLDVTGFCGNSEYAVPENETMFSPTMSLPWSANFSGDVVFVGGHIHDGGLDPSVTRDGAEVCDSVATYGATPGYVETMDMIGMNTTMDMVHISNMSACADVGRMEKGEKWGVQANYDFMQHAAMMDGDMVAPVMGISLIYVAEDKV